MNTKTVRQFSVAGPCIAQGEVIGESQKFWTIRDRFNPGEARKVGKTWKNHIEPCVSCRDHPRTLYPNGYEN